MSDSIEKSLQPKDDLLLVCAFAALGGFLVWAFTAWQSRVELLRAEEPVHKSVEERFDEFEELPLGEQKSFPTAKTEEHEYISLIISDETDVTITIMADEDDDDLIATLFRYEGNFDWFAPLYVDDDSGEGENPKIQAALPRGKYLLLVAHFDKIEEPVYFSARADANVSRGNPAGGG